jgi:hypothetical protein
MELIIRLTALAALLAGSALVLRHVILADLVTPRPEIVRKPRVRTRPTPALKRAA